MTFPLRLRVIRDLPAVRAGAVREAVLDLPENTDGARVTIWPGLPPPPPPSHPGLAVHRARGRVEGRPVWIEDRPDGPLLGDLTGPFPQREAASLVARLADALAALHAAGRAHGALDAWRVALGRDGLPVLLGAGAADGSPDDDVAALRALHARLVARPPETGPADTATELGQALRHWLASLGSADAPLRAVPEGTPVPADAALIEVDTASAEEPLDELAAAPGPEDHPTGLLDGWSERSGDTGDTSGDTTGERTGFVGIGEDAQRVIAALARLAADPLADADPSRWASAEGTPCRSVVALVRAEPLDPLPVPDGTTAAILSHVDEPSGEVTAVSWAPGRSASAGQRHQREVTAELLDRPTSVPSPVELAADAEPATSGDPTTGSDAPERRGWVLYPPEIGRGLLTLAVVVALLAVAAALLLVSVVL